MTEIKKNLTVISFDPNRTFGYKSNRVAEISSGQKPKNPVDTIDRKIVTSEMMAHSNLDGREKLTLVGHAQLKTSNQSLGSAPDMTIDYGMDDFIDRTKLSENISQEAADGRPFFLMRITARTSKEKIVHLYTSAANFYNKNVEFDKAFESQGLTWMSCDVLLVLSPLEKPVKICDYAEIYLDEYDITHEQESIFLLNAKNVAKEQEVKKMAAVGYIAAMLDGGFILPMDKQASKKIIEGIPNESRPLKLSLALEHLANRGDRENFVSWISMGASIQTAMSHGFNPILHAMVARKWEIFDVILSQDLSFLGKEKLISFSNIAKEKCSSMVADAFYKQSQIDKE